MKDIIYPKRGENLSNWITRQTSSNATNAGNDTLNFWIAPTLVSHGGTENYPEIHSGKGEYYHPARRVEGGFLTWSMLKRSKSGAKKSKRFDADPLSEDIPGPATAPNHGLNQGIQGADGSPKKRQVALPRKKELGVPGFMTTVQESSLDSPTIPGHPPMEPSFERSKSGPERTLRRTSAERKGILLRESNYQEASAGKVSEALHIANPPEKAIRRVGSRNLWEELAPLVIPSSTQSQETLDTCTPSRLKDIDDPRPQVPPKSPRTESRASPRSKKLLHSASSSTSTTYTGASPSSGTNTSAGQLCMTQDSNSSLSLLQTTNAEKSTTPTAPWDQVSRIKSPPSHQRNAYPLPVRSTSSKRPPPAVKAQLWHHRGISEASVIDRGRPMKRGDTSLIRSLSRPMLRSPSIGQGLLDIPSGFKATEAPCKVPDEESRYLKKLADEQAEVFKVLPIKQVSKLSKELRFLEERCEILRNTHASLRQGRRSLHTRIITYLKSPRMGIFSHDRILRQEEALAELDKSIDDWVMKLEQAVTRRAQVHQRLLEHIAAALTLTPTGRPESQQVIDDIRSSINPPELENSCKSERHHVQSIKVYADSAVAALLAEIEQDIGMMEDTSNSARF